MQQTLINVNEKTKKKINLPSSSSTPKNETHEYKNGKWTLPKSINKNEKKKIKTKHIINDNISVKVEEVAFLLLNKYCNTLLHPDEIIENYKRKIYNKFPVPIMFFWKTKQ